MEVQFAANVSSVCLDSFGRNEQPLGDFLVGEALLEQDQYIELAIAQPGRERFIRCRIRP